MSFQDYQIAKEIIKKSIKFSNFRGPTNEALIDKAENYLSVNFPPTYRAFLKEFGAGGLGSFEIYGVVTDDFVNSGIPDVVWITAKGRKEWKLPEHLIPIYDLGDGELFCLDLSLQIDNEAKIVAYTPGYSFPDENLGVIAEDFGALLLQLVQQELT